MSGQGLLLTNHHVAYRGIQQISSKEHNYLRDGFRARTRQEERPVSGYSATVTLRCEEVTDRILKGLKKNASEEERTRHVRARTEAVINETRPSVPDKAVRFQVKELFDGAAFYLYHLKTYRDVRLVYAPPAAIGEFGGDPDNWMWPRHCGDFSLMRVYAGPGGEPARRQDANVPLVPEQWLKLSRRGVKEGDLTFILGFPARTHRELTAHSVRYHRDTSLPTNIERFQSMADRISGTNSSDGARPLRSLPALKGILNGLKNYQGKVEWMKKKGLVESLKAVEDELARFVRRRTTLQRKYGKLFDDLDEAYRRVANSEQLSARMKQVDRLQVMRVAAVLHQLGIERARPDASRNRRFRENRLDRLKTRTLRGWDEVDLAAEGKAFEEAIAAFHDVPDEALPEALREVVKGQPAGDARRDALAGMARRVWKETRLKDPKTAPAWFDLDAAKQQELKDPLLDLAGSLAGVRSGLSQARGEQRYKAHRRALHEVRQIQHPGPTYPDADGTLRFTYGRVRGYRPRDAVDYDYITSLGGVVEKETGQEPFASPPRLLTLHRKRDFGPYVDAHLKDVPVAFVQDTDNHGRQFRIAGAGWRAARWWASPSTATGKRSPTITGTNRT